MSAREVDVAVVGAGPAGLTAAAELARAGARVLVLEREAEAGGIPRHSDHTGYGLRDLRRVMSGPTYARRLVDAASTAGAEVLTAAMATHWSGPLGLEVTCPAGRLTVRAGAVILATGARERPRTARLIAGDRPAGVMTTGQLQQQVHLHGGRVGTRAVVVGAELVSWSAVLTLREAGCGVALMSTIHERAEAYPGMPLAGRALLRTPVATRTRVSRIIGRERVEAVEVEDLRTGERRLIACDTVVLTGDWVPDSELARAAGALTDAGHRGPIVDTALRTSLPGVFAAGNLCHPVDTADVASLDGVAAAHSVRDWLDGVRPHGRGVRLHVAEPLRWVAPSVLRAGDPAPPRGRLLLWADEAVTRPRVVARQDGRVVAERRVPWPVSPGRVFRLPWSLLDGVNRYGADVTLSLG